MAHSRSLAFPDFLSRVAASVRCVWFSLERTTSVVAGKRSEAGNQGALGMTKRRG
jgi:fumarate reductase subunit C